MMKIGYMRVSTHEQTTDLQRDALIKAGVDDDYIYADTGSGSRKDHPGWTLCNQVLRKGDTLIVWRLDRLGRSLQNLISIVDDLMQRDISLHILKGMGANIDTTTAEGRLFFGFFAALAEYERTLIAERTRAGLAAARARGRLGGRPWSLTPTQVLGLAEAMKDPAAKPGVLARELGITVPTIYRYVTKKGELTDAARRALAAGKKYGRPRS